jgi:spoIIIJ-associated protein
MDTVIQETVEEILTKLCTPFRKVRMEQQDNKTYRVNIESEEPSLLIGHHGENIYALQNIVRTILWSKRDNEFNVVIDVDNYRKRQEDNVIKLAERKIETIRNTGETQSLPPMSPYFRRVIHLHIAANYDDMETESVGEGDFRYLIIKPKQDVS